MDTNLLNNTSVAELIEFQQRYHTFLRKNEKRLLKEDNLNEIFELLTELEWDKDYVLDDYHHPQKTDWTLHLYARPISVMKPTKDDWLNRFGVDETFPAPLPIFDHITLPYTEMAMWQAIWLSLTYTIIGMIWHGRYSECKFICRKGQLTGYKKLMEHFKERCCFAEPDWNAVPDNLSPVITLNDDGFAEVKLYLWNDWIGLFLKTFNIHYDFNTKRIISIEKHRDKELIRYECSIMF